MLFKGNIDHKHPLVRDRVPDMSGFGNFGGAGGFDRGGKIGPLDGLGKLSQGDPSKLSGEELATDVVNKLRGTVPSVPAPHPTASNASVDALIAKLSKVKPKEIRGGEGVYYSVPQIATAVAEAGLAFRDPKDPKSWLSLVKSLGALKKAFPTLSSTEVVILEAIYSLTGRAFGKQELMTLRTGHSTEEAISEIVEPVVNSGELTKSLSALIEKKLIGSSEGHYYIRL